MSAPTRPVKHYECPECGDSWDAYVTPSDVYAWTYTCCNGHQWDLPGDPAAPKE